MEYELICHISGKGTGDNQFTARLRGIAVDGNGLIHAVGDAKVKVFDRNGKLMRRYDTEGPGYCVYVEADGTTFVGQAGKMAQFDATGWPVKVWDDADRMGLVTSIATHGDAVLLADAQDRCIRRYDREGNWQLDIGRDNNTKGFLIPNGHLDFCVDGEGVIHAANPAKFRVERYSLSGEMLGRFGRFGTKRVEDFPGCCNPTNLALTPEGYVVVTEKAGPRMKVYDAEGKMLAYVAAEAFHPECKNMDVAVDAQGTIYVVNTVTLQIGVFARRGGGGAE